MTRLLALCLTPLLLAFSAHAGIIEDIQARLDRIELRLASGSFPPEGVPTTPAPTPPAATGGVLRLDRGQPYAEVRVSTVGAPAAFQGELAVPATITVLPIRGGGRPILVTLYANGSSLGNGPDFDLPAGSYRFVLSGGSQIPGAEQSVSARPK